MATAALSRVISAVAPLALIPLTLSYLGADLYGLWMAVAAVTVMAAFTDLGLGYGLMTKLATCYATGNTEKARRYISSAYVMVTLAAVAACGVLWLAAGAIPWSSIFNAGDSVTPGQARGIALACLTAFLLNVPLSLVNRIQYAYQRIGMSNMWLAAGVLASLPLAFFAVRAEMPPVVVVASAVAGPVLTNLVNTLWTYWRCLPEIAPRLRLVDRRVAGELIRLGGQFFLLTIVMTTADNADSLIVAHTRGLATVATYAVAVKLFAQLGFLVMLVNQPFWPMHGEALATGDLVWVRRTVRRMIGVSALVVAVPAVSLVLLGDRIFLAWLSVPVGNRWLLAGLGLWWILLAALSPLFMVQNAAGLIRPQIVGYSLYLVLAVSGKWYGSTFFGVASIPFIGVLCSLLTVVPAAIYGYRRVLRMPVSKERVVAGAGV
ncbi:MULTISPECIES: lipopolysaccharide biosynthesis protein [Micromonospora]|uniref:lipopolysaccharide biosynthesis protein n=1 Tax=Micromonospora chalcea TaxID=1874 RepID=UPI002378D025|nr:oligosaccharide flippase family protein [Micromonospora chalcea]WDQ00492.1 oligosaccharide flippase family protein [Micromonospora chalcea]